MPQFLPTPVATGKAPPCRVDNGLPTGQAAVEDWLRRLIAEAEAADKPLLPVVAAFQQLIEHDPEVYPLFNLMFEQVPHRPPYNQDPTGKPLVRSYQHMLVLVNHIITQAPEFNETSMVGFPLNTVLDWAMGTTAGFAAFQNPKVNHHLKQILGEWSIFLGSAESCVVLHDDPRHGWFGADARAAMPHFAQEFVCQPELPHYGFNSWDDFFTREFRQGQRPIASPHDPAVIANACESAPYRLAQGVQWQDEFWLKAQPYSLTHMLAHDPLTEKFVGGTVYQAYLSALSYHRWHSPVSGTIVKTCLVEGTYYAEVLSAGCDPSAPHDYSQGYLTEVATRTLIFIEADNPAIGMLCVLLVGMAEVSSCQVTVRAGQHVQKGQQLGMFHFGGSTHCLLFGPQVKLAFDLRGQQPGLSAGNIPLGARLATVLG